MITREQVRDLQPGDVVRIRNINWPEGTSVTGPAYHNPDTTLTQLFVGGHPVKTMAVCGTLAEFEVVSRAPRPLYVNHPRTDPVPGDVVRDADSDDRRVWLHQRPSDEPDDEYPWVGDYGGDDHWYRRDALPARLRLLVDGETGQVVTS